MVRLTPSLWLAVFLWWTLHGLALAMQVLNMPGAGSGAPTAAYALRTGLVGAWLWVPLTMAVLWLSQRQPLERGRWPRALLVHGAAIVAIVVLRALAVAVLNPWVGWYAQVPSAIDLLTTSLLGNLILSGLVIGSAHALLFHRRAQLHQHREAELEARLAQARLQTLSAQLNPHFLFNALNSIAELVHQDAEAADRMLVALGELLRASLDRADIQEVALAEELRLLRRYVDIEKIRLQERLRVVWRVDPAMLAVPVPWLVLQPLVENAIRHAVAARPGPGRIAISAQRHGGFLCLQVRDDGPGPADAANGSGIGLANTRERLQHLYGDRHRFSVAGHPDGGTVAELAVPLPADLPAQTPDAAPAQSRPSAAEAQAA